MGGLSVFAWVFITTFPVAIPFIFMQNAAPALRVSNAIAIALLFICGYRFAQITGNRRWVMGLAMAVVGSVLVGMTIALGG
jgi:VIT1/CCC1 family predicted Fe2+/Mn2+ transporter